MTFDEFLLDYRDKHEQCESYRLGQHFINLFIKDSSSLRFQKLWNERNFKLAKFDICEYINEVHWDCEDLPIREDRLCM